MMAQASCDRQDLADSHGSDVQYDIDDIDGTMQGLQHNPAEPPSDSVLVGAKQHLHPGLPLAA